MHDNNIVTALIILKNVHLICSNININDINTKCVNNGLEMTQIKLKNEYITNYKSNQKIQNYDIDNVSKCYSWVMIAE